MHVWGLRHVRGLQRFSAAPCPGGEAGRRTGEQVGGRIPAFLLAMGNPRCRCPPRGGVLWLEVRPTLTAGRGSLLWLPWACNQNPESPEEYLSVATFISGPVSHLSTAPQSLMGDTH